MGHGGGNHEMRMPSDRNSTIIGEGIEVERGGKGVGMGTSAAMGLNKYFTLVIDIQRKTFRR